MWRHWFEGRRQKSLLNLIDLVAELSSLRDAWIAMEAGRYLALVEYGEGGRRGFVIIPEGMKGMEELCAPLSCEG
jgi:hypothetical protein